MKTFYEVFAGGVDHNDGHSIGFFETKKLAEAAAKGQGVMGQGDGFIVERRMYTKDDAKQDASDEEVLKTLTKKQLAALQRKGKI